MVKFIFIRNLLLTIIGVWYFEFYLDYKLPSEDNLLLFFVAIPILWATVTTLWISSSYEDAEEHWSLTGAHILSILMLFSTVFIISIVLNTISSILDPLGTFFFHIAGWTVLWGIIMYDIIDGEKRKYNKDNP